MNNMTILFAIAKGETNTSEVLQISARILDSLIPFWEEKILNVLKIVTIEDQCIQKLKLNSLLCHGKCYKYQTPNKQEVYKFFLLL